MGAISGCHEALGAAARALPRSLPYRLGLTVVVGLLLVGCGKHYWSKSGAGPSDFLRESSECARENAVQVSASKDYGTVVADLYKVCLKSRGWICGQQFEPPPAGWFRDIEDDGLMRLESPQPAPQPAAPAPAPAPQPQTPSPAPPQPPPTR
jgi:hypothetical protein